ncbi:hypothetical protein D3C73_936920 [compost metagenome]
MPGFTHGVDHLGTRGPAGQHLLDQRGRVLQVGIQTDHGVADGGLQPGAQGGFLAKVA